MKSISRKFREIDFTEKLCLVISRVFILLKVCGREDGSIILVPATQTIMLHMLSGRHQKFPNWPQHQILLGMNLALGRVKQNFRVSAINPAHFRRIIQFFLSYISRSFWTG